MMMQSLRLFILLGLVGAGLISAGCASVMAARQPSAKNLDVLKIGTPRPQVIAELGWPNQAAVTDGKRTDNFTILQGYSKGAKISRSLLHGLADTVTLGLWEVVGTPTEMVFHGTNLLIRVCYDLEEKVAESKILKNE